MITKIRISNFYSIGEEIKLDFLRGGAKKEEGYFSYKKDEKISLINGFFGANASGKSNILGAIVSIIRMMYNVYLPLPQNTFPQGVASRIFLCHQNAHCNFKDKSTKLGIDFLFGNNYYTYDLEIKDGNNILKEELFLTTLDIKSAKPKEIFTRTDASVSFGSGYKEYEAYVSNIKIEKYQTFVSHLINIGANAISDFKDRRDSFFLKIDSLDLSMPSPVAIMMRAQRIAMLEKDKKEEALKITTDILSCFDDSIESINIKTENNNISVSVGHKDFSREIDMARESAGTRELFCYAYDLLNAFKMGGVVVYDETNRYYHPDVENALLSIFKNTTFNTKNAQLFFASHNHETFGLLEPDQAYIVEKTNYESSAYKLSDVKDLKKRDNIKKKYRLGMLGGVPDVVAFDYNLKQML